MPRELGNGNEVGPAAHQPGQTGVAQHN
jgi:hypothetical protein